MMLEGHIRDVIRELSDFTNAAIKINDRGLQQFTRKLGHRSHRLRLYNIRNMLEAQFIDHTTFRRSA